MLDPLDPIDGRRASRSVWWMAAAVCLLGVALALAVPSSGTAPSAATKQSGGGLQKISHLIVIYQENWSFDGLYGKFPGANGLTNAGSAARQVDKKGTPYVTLPQPTDSSKKPPAPDPRMPANLPNGPFDLLQFISPAQKTRDLWHRFYLEQLQIDGGKMDRFAAWSNAAGFVMSYFDASNLPEGKLAQQYTMCDNFFHSAFGGSFLNHFWLIAARTPIWPGAPADFIAQPDPDGTLLDVSDKARVTPDGYVVNTSFTLNKPHPNGIAEDRLMPRQTFATIGDRLSDKGVSWAWYAGGWNDALAGSPDPYFQFHHQPFNYFASFADGTKAKAEHLKDIADFVAALGDGTLPAVSFVKPLGPHNEHPGYADLLTGQIYIAGLVQTIQGSPFWKDCAIIITYDENGGRWDHVAPPSIDRWGPGARVPTIVISPFAKRRFVDHTQYETVSILKLIESRWELKALSDRDARAANLLGAFDFSQKP